MMDFKVLLVTSSAALFLLSACSTTDLESQDVAAMSSKPGVTLKTLQQKDIEIKPGDPNYRPPRDVRVNTVAVPTGSLFTVGSDLGLYQVHKNYRVGDMIFVHLEENTRSQKSLDFNTDKSSKFEVSPVNVTLGGLRINENDIDIETSQERDFESSASANQSNSMQGSITVYVTDVLVNGNLVVAGEKWITLNKGREFIRFSGEVRSRDVAIDNSISSLKVGNALIEYSGTGALQDNQNGSILDRVIGMFN